MRLFLLVWFAAASAGAAQGVEPAMHCQVSLGHHIYETERICPLGGETFAALELGSYSTYGRHLDWQPVSYMQFPVPVPICPSNGFILDRPEADFSAELIETRRIAIEDPAYRALLGENTSFFLLARLYEITGEQPEEVWWLYLNATWEAEMCDFDFYEEYAREVIRTVDAQLATISPDDDLFMLLNLQALNMRRRIGEFESARASLAQFRAGNPDRFDENWTLVFARLEAALEARDSSQLEINPSD